MLRIQTKSDRLGFFLPVSVGLVIFLAAIVYSYIVIIPDKLGFVMIIGGLVIVYIGLSGLVKKLEMIKPMKFRR